MAMCILWNVAQEMYDFVAALDEANQFNFDKLVPWRREQWGQRKLGFRL
jgi:hypothetical protein